MIFFGRWFAVFQDDLATVVIVAAGVVAGHPVRTLAGIADEAGKGILVRGHKVGVGGEFLPAEALGLEMDGARAALDARPVPGVREFGVDEDGHGMIRVRSPDHGPGVQGQTGGVSGIVDAAVAEP